jgi:hypothetical protein
LSGYRCQACGNKTRFDVFESKRMRSFHHFSLGGDMRIEEEETLESHLERVVCRWCGSSEVVGTGAAARDET